MTITPQQAKEAYLSTHNVEEFVPDIDEYLKMNWNGVSTLHWSPVRRVDFRTLQRIASHYEKAGWKAKAISDQRDGDWIDFSV